MATKSNINSIRKQVAAIQNNAKRVIKDKIPLNIERALTAVGVVVANKAQEYTPIEYGLLQNSQYRLIEATPNSYRVKWDIQPTMPHHCMTALIGVQDRQIKKRVQLGTQEQSRDSFIQQPKKK